MRRSVSNNERALTALFILTPENPDCVIELARLDLGMVDILNVRAFA